MKLDRNKLYAFLFIVCLAGYYWLYFNITKTAVDHSAMGVCMIKYGTNMPCPSCGSTRSIISLTEGNFLEALKINPLGIIVAVIMLVTPLWIVVDLIRKKNSLFDFYKKSEGYLKKPKYAFPLVILVMLNWFWNIAKGL